MIGNGFPYVVFVVFVELKLSKRNMDTDPVRTYHLMIEAIKFTYSLRPGLGDSDFEPKVKDVIIFWNCVFIDKA